jgi:hypothetical protein
LAASERICKYNEKAGFDVKQEIMKNNREAVNLLARLQKQICTNPAVYLYLKNLHK